MSDRYILVEDTDSFSYGTKLVDTDTDEVVMSDSWVPDAPEDATLTRAYSVLVDIMNELAFRLRELDK